MKEFYKKNKKLAVALITLLSIWYIVLIIICAIAIPTAYRAAGTKLVLPAISGIDPASAGAAQGTADQGLYAALLTAIVLLWIVFAGIGISCFVISIILAVGTSKLDSKVYFILFLVGIFNTIVGYVGACMFINQANKEITKQHYNKPENGENGEGENFTIQPGKFD